MIKHKAVSRILSDGDSWTPEKDEDRHLARTIIGTHLQDVFYICSNNEDELHVCRYNTFEQWVSKMRCGWSNNYEYVEIWKKVHFDD